MAWTVGETAKLAHVSVRTLHHYDQIGLLKPSGRSNSGYRLYETADLERLQEILLFRELGFDLATIRRMTLEAGYDRTAALVAQRGLLEKKARRTESMLRAIERALEATDKGVKMDEKDMFEVFGDFDPREHEDEVEKRWSGPLLDESRKRTARYTKDDWKRTKAESDELTRELAELMQSGAKPDDERALELVEKHRHHIDETFYPCSYEVHAGLGRMYVEDERFKKHYEKVAPGLAQFVCDAIQENARRKEA